MDKADTTHVELECEEKPVCKATGQVNLYQGNQLVLIPTPSRDPRGTPPGHFILHPDF
jgi:hypothetical protein